MSKVYFLPGTEAAPLIERLEPLLAAVGLRRSVAIDQATLELIGPGAFAEDPTIRIRRAESLGLGSREYDLIRV
jgi:uncharacterized Fe-S center protein